MKTYQPNTTITLINDPEDFQPIGTIQTEWELQYQRYLYSRLTNAEISLLSKRTYPYHGNFEEGVY